MGKPTDKQLTAWFLDRNPTPKPTAADRAKARVLEAYERRRRLKAEAFEQAAAEICKRCQRCHGVQWPTGCIYCRPEVDAIRALAKVEEQGDSPAK